MSAVTSRFISSSDQISPAEKERISQEIVGRFSVNLKGPSQERPLVILLGGFQGAGKSTVSKSLKETHGVAILSTDAIRQALLDRNITGTLFAEMVASVSTILLSRCFESRISIVLDANAHAKRIKDVQDLLKSYPSYTCVKIYLDASPERLIERVRERPKVEGFYLGSEADLMESLSKAQFDKVDYDLIIDTEKMPLKDEIAVINSFLAAL